jgi:hypothetical protein
MLFKQNKWALTVDLILDRTCFSNLSRIKSEINNTTIVFGNQRQYSIEE